MGSGEEEKVTQVTHDQQVAWLSGPEARRSIFLASVIETSPYPTESPIDGG